MLFVDENQFFREVTLRICGSLEIEKALWNCFLYMQEVMPADQLILTTYDRYQGTLRVVATANSTGGALHADDTSLPSVLRKEIEDAAKYPRVRIANDVFQDPIVSHVAHQRHWEPSSAIVNRLLIEGRYVGALIVRALGTGRYTEKHLEYWALVNEPAAVALSNSEKYRELSARKDLLADDRNYLQNELRKGIGVEVVGADFGLKDVMDKARNVAPLESPVLLIGETGTGKEVIANAIHSLSPRSEGPLIKVNCGAIPGSLIDSELFGHERGAFTGALTQKRGRFERAHGGTIFLDEIGELPLQGQIRFLRVLQEKEIERVGGSSSIKIDVRVISATNRNLEDLVARKRFREDLYFRLRVFPIVVPRLKDRKGDIPALVQHLIQKKARQMVLPKIPTLAKGAIDQLIAYDWPGNVRELENAVERAIILSTGRPLSFEQILAPLRSRPAGTVDNAEEVLTLNEMEARHIKRVLDKAKGKVEGRGGAAELLNVNPGTLRHRMRKLGIPFGRPKQ
jgi:transcriptional regulator with GAF, ATPase, and Fis domain